MSSSFYYQAVDSTSIYIETFYHNYHIVVKRWGCYQQLVLTNRAGTFWMKRCNAVLRCLGSCSFTLENHPTYCTRTAVAVHTRGITPLRLLFCIGLALRISANNTAITTASVGLKPNSAPFGDTLISRSNDLSVRFDNPTHKK